MIRSLAVPMAGVLTALLLFVGGVMQPENVQAVSSQEAAVLYGGQANCPGANDARCIALTTCKDTEGTALCDKNSVEDCTGVEIRNHDSHIAMGCKNKESCPGVTCVRNAPGSYDVCAKSYGCFISQAGTDCLVSTESVDIFGCLICQAN